MFATVATELLFFTFCLALVLYALRRKRPRKFPPGPQPIPVIGNLHQLGLEPYKTFMTMSKKYGGIFAIDFASYRGIVLNDYKLIRQCFSETSFSGRPNLRPFSERSGGKVRGVICAGEEQWTEQRRFILKNLRDFGFGKKSMEGLIQEEILELIENFKDVVGKPVSTQNKFNAAVLNSLWRICSGERFSMNDPKFTKLLAGIHEALADTKAAGAAYFFPTLTKMAPELTGFNNFIRMTDPITDIVQASIDEHKATYDAGHKRDLIDAYWEQILKTSDQHSSFFGAEGEKNMLYSLLDLFLAGAETTSTTLTWAFLLLAVHPEVQENLYEEIKAVVGDSRLPGLDDKQSMPYTECVILEVMRFSALVPLGVFHNTTQDVMVDGYMIPKDTMVISNLYGALHDPVWGDPENFRPERFLLPDGTVDRHHQAHVAFSTGKRVCLGESLARDELFLFMTSLFQHFKVETDPTRPCPSLEYHVAAVLAPKYHEIILNERH